MASLLLAVLWNAPSPAQQADRGFRVLGYGPSYFRDISFENAAGEAVPVVFLPNQKSRRYPLESERAAITFFQERVDEQGERAREILGRVRLDPAANSYLFVFLESEAADPERSLEILPLDESRSVWGAGCVRFLNLTGAPLRAKLGGDRLLLGFGPSPIYQYEHEGVGALPFALSVEVGEGEERLVYSSRLAPDSRYGKLLVLKPPLEEGSFRVRVENLW